MLALLVAAIAAIGMNPGLSEPVPVVLTETSTDTSSVLNLTPTTWDVPDGLGVCDTLDTMTGGMSKHTPAAAILDEMCFEAGTLVSVPTGTVSDEAGHWRLGELASGDRFAHGGLVYEARRRGAAVEVRWSGEVLGRVTRTFVRRSSTLVDLVVAGAEGGRPISGTREHPFWAEAAGSWVALGELDAGAVLLSEGGGEREVLSVAWRDGKFEVFNFEVEGVHDYFVAGAGTVEMPGVLVHNSSGGMAGEVTTLHRAVGPAELADIKSTGKLQAGPGMEGKWFAESGADAKTWGEKMDFGGDPTVIEADFPKSTADGMFRVEKLDGIGPARYAEEAQLGDCCAVRVPDE